MLISGLGSTNVTVAEVFVPSVPLLGLERLTENCSAPEAAPSARSGIEIVCDVVPGVKVRVPLVVV